MRCFFDLPTALTEKHLLRLRGFASDRYLISPLLRANLVPLPARVKRKRPRTDEVFLDLLTTFTEKHLLRLRGFASGRYLMSPFLRANLVPLPARV